MTEKPAPADSMTDKANAAFRQAARKVIELAIRTGTPVIVWEDGQVKEVPPECFVELLSEDKSESRR